MPQAPTLKGERFKPEDVTEEDLAAIEDALFSRYGHWPILDPKRVIAACANQMHGK